MFEESNDDRLFNDFINAHQQMDGPTAQKCVQSMSDDGLFNAAFKIHDLSKNDPGYMICNVALMGEFTKRPHLRNPFVG